MDTDIYAQYRDFWTLFSAADKYQDRKACSLRQWMLRSPQARQAMLEQLRTQGPPANRNPYFWIQDFPEPGLTPAPRAAILPPPTNYYGRPLPKGYEFFRATYNGQRGLYTAQDVQTYHMSNPEIFEL